MPIIWAARRSLAFAAAVFVLGTATPWSLIVAAAVFLLGTVAFLVRARLRGEWPFEESRQ